MTNKTTSAIDLVERRRERVRDFIYDCTKDEFNTGWTLSAHQTDDLIALVESDTITRLQAALTPNAETKAAYIGDFKFDVPLDGFDEDGEQLFGFKSVTVPWDTIKEIMAAIREHASSVGGE